MKKIVKVMFPTTKVFEYYECHDLDLKVGDGVIVQTSYGIDYAIVKKESYVEKEENLPDQLLPVIRLAKKQDQAQLAVNEKNATAALEVAKKYSKSLDLDMNFVDCYYTFDKNQLIFTFVSENRVDFRELAKKLAQKYKTRIELRQIGVRDKAKKIGGIGPCGLFLCCNAFLTDFNSVSINMAKNQFLALNPAKINGSCGRLLCCLNYEDEVYTELKKGLPTIGSLVETKEGLGKVMEVDVFKRTYKAEFKDKGVIEFSVNE